MRDYSAAVAILGDLKVKSVRLLTNNPDKIKSFENTEIACVARIPLEVHPNKNNRSYLKTKRDVTGHMLSHV
jgi:GTP cyclohydrolase II